MEQPVEGKVSTYSRTFTAEEVQQFADVSGDDQPRHTEPDEDGRVMVQGLLTATMPTKLGGDVEVLAHSMDLQFLKPVYTGEEITCRSMTDTVTERDDRYEVTFDVVCEDEDGEAVLRATIDGMIFKDE